MRPSIFRALKETDADGKNAARAWFFSPCASRTRACASKMYLAGKEVGVQFMARLRDEQRFDGVDALVAQIQADIAAAGDYLDGVTQAL